MIFDNGNKQAFFVNVYDNDMKTPDKDYDKLIIVKETERREKGTPEVSSDAPF
jgi:SOS-response transcriptional repressor LexA